MRNLRGFLLAILVLSCAALAHAQISITEFVASNVEGIVDEDGNHEDWVEIRNTGLATVNLSGWFLTDSASQLRKWAFPSKSLSPGQYLVVFASNKNRRDPLKTLHTNFKLDGGGEYLAITKAETNGGTTIVQSWNPYPPQAADVSYGITEAGAVSTLVSASSPVKFRIPNATTGPAMGTTWRGANEPFDETGWTAGVAALGHGGVPNPSIVAGANCMHRFNSSDGQVNYDTSGNTRTASNTGVSSVTSAKDTAPSPLKRNGVLSFVGTENDQFVVNSHTSYNVASPTVCFWMKANPPTGSGSSGAMLWDRRAGVGVGLGIVIVQQDDGRILVQSEGNFCLLTSTVNVSDDQWHHIALTMNQAVGETVTLYVDGQPAGSTVNTGTWTWSGTQPIEIGRSHDPYWKRYTGLLDDIRFYNRNLTATEISDIAGGADTTMDSTLFSTKGVASSDWTTSLINMTAAGTNPSVFVRVPFTIADLNAINGVIFSVQQTDGFVAWINGVQVAAVNAPASPLWNSPAASSAARDPGRFHITSIPASGGPLLSGTNMLSIQLMNNAVGQPNVLLRPTVESISATSGTSVYFTSETPGAANAAALSNVGPHIANTTKNPVPPTGGAGSLPLVISTDVKSTLNPVGSVQLAYRVMWGGETLIPMLDNGVAPDLVANDKKFTAQIPTTGLGVGQMLRWRVVASDSAGNVSTDPLFIDLDGIAGQDTDQYFGTIAPDAGYTTALPVLHWFVENPGNAETLGGTRTSIFFLGRFYDFVEVNLHGQSTSGFPKKSFNLSFNKDNRFRWKVGETEIRSVNFLSNYADKSKLRNSLAWAAWADSKHAASHFSESLHVRRATPAEAMQFFSIADMVEDGNEEYLERCGLDKDGALYKSYNSLQSALPYPGSGGDNGLKKKTREFEDNSDLQAFVTGIGSGRTTAQRRQYLYDNVNVPALINFCVVHSLINNTDWGHKNYYIYRDTMGTKEWYPLPWDQDLSFGHSWWGAQNYFDDEIHSQGTFPSGGGGNNLMQLVYNVPELNDMFRRRARTLMDQILISATATDGIWDARVTSFIDRIDPVGATYLTDADRELQRWGWWVDGNSTPQFGGVLDAAIHTHGARAQAMRILNANPNPPQTSQVSGHESGNSTFAFLPGRRAYLFNNAAALGIPATQPASPALSIEDVDFNPASANQDDEYFVIRNTSGAAVDLSGWKITGAVDYVFPAGTVIPAFTTGTENIGRLHVAKSPAAFRVRTVGATGGQYRLVVGPYSGSMSARGEIIELRRPDDSLLMSQTWTAAPTLAQNQLRVSEINYAPTAPTLAEAAAIPGVSAADFEFIELVNTSATTLNVAGARFTRGIEFTFPLGATIAPGARVVLVSNQAAFVYRYGAGANIGGQFLGNLNNGGDTLRIADSMGEEVLEFSYEPSWFPQSDGGGYSLVARNAAPGFADYGSPSAPLPAVWALSAAPGGSPGAGDSDNANGFEGWRFNHWTLGEVSALGAPVATTADADGDGLSNFAEYAYGRNPRVHDAASLSSAGKANVSGTDYPTVTFIRRHLAVDVAWSVQESPDLVAWNSTAVLVSTTQLGNGLEQVTYRSATPSSSVPRYFRVVAIK